MDTLYVIIIYIPPVCRDINKFNWNTHLQIKDFNDLQFAVSLESKKSYLITLVLNHLNCYFL